MSTTSIRIKLKKIDLKGKSNLDFCAEEVNKSDKKIRNNGLAKSGYDDYFEAFDDLLSSKFLRKGENIYQILSEEENEFALLVRENKDETLDIQLYFNDGASTWQDIVKEGKEIE